MFGISDNDVALKRVFMAYVIDMMTLLKNFFVKGPPGSGKTEFLLAFAFKMMITRGSRVLFLAPQGAYENVKDQLAKQRRWVKFPENWKTDEHIGYGLEEMENFSKQLVIAQICSPSPFNIAAFDWVIIDHLNTVNEQIVRAFCLDQGVHILGAYDDSIPFRMDSAILSLEAGGIPNTFIQRFHYSSRPDEIMQFISEYCPSFSGVEGSENARIQMEFVDSEGLDQILEKVKQLLKQGVPETDIGVTALNLEQVTNIRSYLKDFPGVCVEAMEFWSTATVSHFLVSLYTLTERNPMVQELNLMLTRARKSLTVFGNQAKISKMRYIPYYYEFLRLIIDQEPEEVEVWEPIRLPDNWEEIKEEIRLMLDPFANFHYLEEPEEDVQEPEAKIQILEEPEEDIRLVSSDSEDHEEDVAQGFQGLAISPDNKVPAPESAPESAPEVSPHPEDPVPEVQGNYFRIIFPPGFKPPQGLRY